MLVGSKKTAYILYDEGWAITPRGWFSSLQRQDRNDIRTNRRYKLLLKKVLSKKERRRSRRKNSYKS